MSGSRCPRWRSRWWRSWPGPASDRALTGWNPSFHPAVPDPVLPGRFPAQRARRMNLFCVVRPLHLAHGPEIAATATRRLPACHRLAPAPERRTGRLSVDPYLRAWMTPCTRPPPTSPASTGYPRHDLRVGVPRQVAPHRRPPARLLPRGRPHVVGTAERPALACQPESGRKIGSLQVVQSLTSVPGPHAPVTAAAAPGGSAHHHPLSVLCVPVRAAVNFPWARRPVPHPRLPCPGIGCTYGSRSNPHRQQHQPSPR